MNTQYLSLSEVAQELSVSRRDVRQIIKSGALTGYEFNKQIKVRADQLSAFIERSKIGGIDAIQKR
jgi:excisionase family DNA binding protein